MFVALNRYNAGDLIACLPGFKKIYETKRFQTIMYQQLNLPAFYYEGAEHPVRENGVMVTMNNDMFDFLRPLLMQQPYIFSYNVWEGQEVGFDFFHTRNEKGVPMPHGSIHHWNFITFPQLTCDLSKPWIEAKPIKSGCDIVINRTERYWNPNITYHFLKKHKKKIGFVGTRDEHEKFCEQAGYMVSYLECADAVELAGFIKGSKLFIGNQSFCWHLADAMKCNRVLELSPDMPNTWPTGEHGYCAAYQNTMEYCVSLYIK
jgi:hypothetical protein